MRSLIAKVFGTKVDLKEALGELLSDLKQELPGMVQVELPECDCAAKHKELLNDREQLANEVTNLKRQKSRAEESLAKAELDHKIKVEDIEHMQKLLDEKNKLVNERAVFQAEKNAEKEIIKIRKEYSDKMESELREERKKMTEFMNQVMAALPNVNVRLGQPEPKE